MSAWQACTDEYTGYTYYWNTLTNEVTWGIPAELQIFTDATNVQHAVNNTYNVSHVSLFPCVNTSNVIKTSNTPAQDPILKKNLQLVSAYDLSSDDDSNIEENEHSSLKNNKLQNTITKFKQDFNLQNQKTTEKLNNNSSDSFSQKVNDENLIESDDNEEDEELDDIIITRLRNKALLLKGLGGEIPKEILTVLDKSKTNEDIFKELEKNISLECDSVVNNNLQSTSGKKSEENDKKQEQILETKTNSRALFDNRKTKTTNITKIKLSAKAKELIKTSLLTAKARATDFVETEEGLKPAELVESLKKLNEDKTNSVIIEKNDVKKCSEETKEKQSGDELKEQSEKNVPNFLKNECETDDYLKIKPEKLKMLNYKKNKSNSFSFCNETIDTRRGLGFSSESGNNALKTEDCNSRKNLINFVKSETINTSQEITSHQDSYTKVNINKKDTNIIDRDLSNPKWKDLVQISTEEIPSYNLSLPSTKTEAKDEVKIDNRNTSNKSCVLNELDEVLNISNENDEKKVNDLTQVIMEKLTFLSEGKNSVSPVQVMAIQIETLVGAWQTKSLTLKYLSDWLDASAVQLKSIEESAAPEGWLCEWDRSYGRYYYRNKTNGAIQWEFPCDEEQVDPKSKLKKDPKRRGNVECPKTPPPPVISEDVIVPPPPIISDHESRKRKTDSKSSYIKNSDKKCKVTSMRSEVLSAPLPPKKSFSPPPLPPMPQSSPPPPPPPPPSPPPPLPSPTSCAGGIPEIIRQQDKNELIPKNNDGALCNELDSFYSDIASIEATFSQNENVQENQFESSKTDNSNNNCNLLERENTIAKATTKTEEKVKKKKKVKLDSVLSLKKKGLEGLVAKWQKVKSNA